MGEQLTLFVEFDPMEGVLKQGNGKPWLAEPGVFVPKHCMICGAPIRLLLEGEPIFRCIGEEKHYYGVLKMEEDNGDI